MNTLAIDQGTTSTRALIVGAGGEVTPLLSLPHRQHYPRSGWVEHDPEELIGNLLACLDAAAGIPDLTAIGLDNQGESCLAWDADTGRAISPVIVWQDDRTASDIERLRGEGVEAMVLERAGLPLDPYFSASKLGWIMREIPEAAQAGSQGTFAAWHHRRLLSRPPDRPLRHRCHHGLAHLADRPRHAAMGCRSVRAVWRADRSAAQRSCPAPATSVRCLSAENRCL